MKTNKQNRLSINITASAKRQIDELTEQSGVSITELVRVGVAIVKIVVAEKANGNKLIICTADGVPISQLVIPWLD